MDIIMPLGRLLNMPPLAIELIPGDGSEWFVEEVPESIANASHRPFLLVDGNLGVPQKILYKAYIIAISFLKQPPSTHGSRTTDILDDEEILEILKIASAVILLANPAHQTALNARKRLVQTGALDVEHELLVTAALLTVREGSKQSILWHHRRWLINRQYHASCPSFPSRHYARSPTHVILPTEVFRTEFSVILRACETYPRNYYAWIHRYIFLEALAATSASPMSSRSDYVVLLMEEYVSVQQWVESHISDHTAMNYLHQVQVFLENIISANDSDLRSISAEPSLLTHAKSLVISYPDHESLWLYLRAAIQHELGKLSDINSQKECTAECITFARQFLHDPSRTHQSSQSPPLLSTDQETIHINTLRFVAWLARQGQSIHSTPSLVRRIVAAGSSDIQLLELLTIPE